MTEARRCPGCGGRMKRGTRKVPLTYRGQTITVDQPGLYCGACGESMISGVDMKATEAAYLEFKARVDGVLSPREVARIREKLGLSQRRASEILGGGVRSFQKYESGKTMLSDAMSNLLRVLDAQPRLVRVLASEASRKAQRRMSAMRAHARSSSKNETRRMRRGSTKATGANPAGASRPT
jgi:HTH-type transcriptional regulator / antitoxin MqsA